MSIYDRAGWPPPEHNPLVMIVKRGEALVPQRELLFALGMSRTTTLLAAWPTLAEQLGDGQTYIESKHYLTPDTKRTGGLERYYTQKAVIIAGMRAQTSNAAAFRDWLATRTAREMNHG